jgi:hypothetical protein
MIVKAIERAYTLRAQRNWDTVYYAIDLHGVCLTSNYTSDVHEFINQDAIGGLKVISDRPETVIIIWSGLHTDQQAAVSKLFLDNGIKIDYFNENPLERNTVTGNFSDKFYFSVLLDDKAGFDPTIHWQHIIDYYLRIA